MNGLCRHCREEEKISRTRWLEQFVELYENRLFNPTTFANVFTKFSKEVPHHPIVLETRGKTFWKTVLSIFERETEWPTLTTTGIFNKGMERYFPEVFELENHYVGRDRDKVRAFCTLLLRKQSAFVVRVLSLCKEKAQLVSYLEDALRAEPHLCRSVIYKAMTTFENASCLTELDSAGLVTLEILELNNAQNFQQITLHNCRNVQALELVLKFKIGNLDEINAANQTMVTKLSLEHNINEEWRAQALRFLCLNGATLTNLFASQSLVQYKAMVTLLELYPNIIRKCDLKMLLPQDTFADNYLMLKLMREKQCDIDDRRMHGIQRAVLSAFSSHEFGFVVVALHALSMETFDVDMLLKMKRIIADARDVKWKVNSQTVPLLPLELKKKIKTLLLCVARWNLSLPKDLKYLLLDCCFSAPDLIGK